MSSPRRFDALAHARRKGKVVTVLVAGIFLASHVTLLIRVTDEKNFSEKPPPRYQAKWAKENPEKVAAIGARRRAILGNATVAWRDDDKIREIYKELTKETGIQHHVDHIIPIKGKNVTGLHVENNLQILTAEENSRKGNRYETNN